MRFKRYSEDISDFAALSTDGHEFRLNQQNPNVGTEYILDTNVLLFLQNPSEVEDSQLRGSAVKYFGRRFVAGNIRACLEDISERKSGFLVTNAHKFEFDVAVRSELEVDYDRMKTSLKDVFLNVAKRYRGKHKAKTAMAAEIVVTLKEHFRDDFKIVSDILIGRPNRTGDLLKAVSEIPSKSLDGDNFSQLSNFLNVVLSAGAERSSFSVRNDIKAIRDIVSENIAREHIGRRPKLIFLTLDQKLLEACRVAKWLGLPSAEHLYVENCPSFWLWQRDPRHERNSKSLARVSNDFLTKSRTILRDIDARYFGSFSTDSRTISEPEMFVAAMKYLEVHGQADESDELHLLLARVIDGFSEVSLSSDNGPQPRLLEALEEFFHEMSGLFPSVQLSISSTDAYEAVLKERLESCGVDQNSFMMALEHDIEKHAKKSMEILGASSLMTRRQPLAAFNEYTRFKSGSAQFHRMPVPIQSTVDVVEKIAALVANEQLSEKMRYAELIKINNLRGLRADLVTAFLAVAAGNWKMAEAICADATFHSNEELEDVEHVAEIHILACSILRIYKTDTRRLERAQERLDKARLLFPGGMDEQRAARVESEEMSIRANRFLFVNFERSFKVVGYDMRPEPARSLLGDLVEHADKIVQSSLPYDVRSKLMANVGVNIVAVLFCGGFDRSKITRQQLRVILSCLNVSLRRISDLKTRVSYYEEIVTLFSLGDLRGLNLKHPIDIGILERKRAERAKYRELAVSTSPFERWVLEHFV